VFTQVAVHDRLERIIPAIGAVHIAGTQHAAFQIAELIEHEQRVVAGALVMTVPDAVLLFAMGRAHARIHVEHDAAGRSAAMHKVDPLAGQVGKSRKVLVCSKPLRLKGANLRKGDAAFFADLDPPQTLALRADEILGNERQTVPRAVARLPAVIGAASDCLPCHWDVSVSCKNIRLSSDVANPLSRSRNRRADGDGWSVCTRNGSTV